MSPFDQLIHNTLLVFSSSLNQVMLQLTEGAHSEYLQLL